MPSPLCSAFLLAAIALGIAGASLLAVAIFVAVSLLIEVALFIAGGVDVGT